MKKAIIPPFLLFLLLFASSAPAIEIGAPAPDFKLPTLNDEIVHLSDYKGHIIVLKLATTWCPTCKQQTFEIQEAGKFLAEKDAVVVEVFVQDTRKMVQDYMKDRHFAMTHVSLIDDGQAYRLYNVYLIPRLLLIDKDFKVRYDGSLTPTQELENKIKQIVAGGEGKKGLEKDQPAAQ